MFEIEDSPGIRVIWHRAPASDPRSDCSLAAAQIERESATREAAAKLAKRDD